MGGFEVTGDIMKAVTNCLATCLLLLAVCGCVQTQSFTGPGTYSGYSSTADRRRYYQPDGKSIGYSVERDDATKFYAPDGKYMGRTSTNSSGRSSLYAPDGKYLGYSATTDSGSKFYAPNGKYLGYSRERYGRTEYYEPNGKLKGYSR